VTRAPKRMPACHSWDICHSRQYSTTYTNWISVWRLYIKTTGMNNIDILLNVTEQDFSEEKVGAFGWRSEVKTVLIICE
jgi:hypothetical protein